MKTQYVTDDGKVFTTKEAAVAHEAKAGSDKEYKEKLKKKLQENNAKMDALNDELAKLAEENAKLLEDWRENHATPDEKKLLDKIDEFFDKMGDLYDI